ncbi:MAG TPA: type I restriction-modification system subunit M [Blastocatellia bacterium]|nr:type I restriction-modification system subunit M [Blastocatellia bacterium]
MSQSLSIQEGQEGREEINQAEINAVALKACDIFRGVVDPSEYKNYVLVFLFFKYVSDVWKDRGEQYHLEYKDDEERIRRRLSRERFIMPECGDFETVYRRRHEPNIGEIIDAALASIEEANKAKLEGVFRNISFNSETHLGETKERNRRLKRLIEDFADPRLDLRPSRVGGRNVIGGAYQFLIEHFASESGKKGGEFYTPPEVSTLLAKLLQPKKGARVCDPACGSGSLLIRVAEEIGDNDFSLFGQESNGGAWALCRMNMFLHGKDAARIEWGDTLNNPRLLEGNALKKFDVVVSNPPFSLDKWGAENAARDFFCRFHRGVPPRGKADYAFITHMIETIAADTGKAAVIVPHGVLFRGGSEGRIRQKMVLENLLDAVIGLPANLFYGTGIPAAILLFNRGKKTTDVLFIDASREYEDAKNQNKLRPQDIEKIVATYKNFESVEKYARRATSDEIRENDFNLNVPRYVDTFAEDEEVDVEAAQKEIEDLEAQLVEARTEMKRYLKELGM